jgi:hypothetical protein
VHTSFARTRHQHLAHICTTLPPTSTPYHAPQPRGGPNTATKRRGEGKARPGNKPEGGRPYRQRRKLS